jgi:hypothetical protein
MINLSDPKILKKLRWVNQALCYDPSRKELYQLKIGPTMTATDGCRVHMAELPGVEHSVCVHGGLASFLVPLARNYPNLKVRVGAGAISTSWWSLDFDGPETVGLPPFPDPTPILDGLEVEWIFHIDAKELRDVIQGSAPTTFIIEDSKIWVNEEINEQSLAKSNDVLSYKNLRVTFLSTYLLEALRSLRGPVTLRFAPDPHKPLHLVYERPGDRRDAIIMPFRQE